MSNEKIQRKLTFLATTFDALRWYAENARIYRGSVPHRGRFLDALCGLDTWGKGIVLDLVQKRISFESHQVVRRKMPLHPLSSATVGVPVLGVWLHVAGNDFCSCCLSDEGQWFDTSVGVDDIEGAMLTTPDGWLPLPVVVIEEE